VGIFPEGEDSHGDHGLGRLVEFRFKGHPGTTSSYYHHSHHRDNVTAPHGRPNLRSRLHFCHAQERITTKSTRTCGGIGKKYNVFMLKSVHLFIQQIMKIKMKAFSFALYTFSTLFCHSYTSAGRRFFNSQKPGEGELLIFCFLQLHFYTKQLKTY